MIRILLIIVIALTLCGCKSQPWPPPQADFGREFFYDPDDPWVPPPPQPTLRPRGPGLAPEILPQDDRGLDMPHPTGVELFC